MTSILLLPEDKIEKKDIIFINVETINFVRVYADNINENNHFTDYYYYHRGKEDLFLYTYAKAGKVLVAVGNGYFDETVTSSNIYELYLFSSQKGLIDIAPPNDFYTRINPQKHFLKFINKHYQQHFKKEDFKDENAMVDYILNKENEKEMLENKK